MQRWRVQKEVASDIVKLALYDIVLYIGKADLLLAENAADRK